MDSFQHLTRHLLLLCSSSSSLTLSLLLLFQFLRPLKKTLLLPTSSFTLFSCQATSVSVPHKKTSPHSPFSIVIPIAALLDVIANPVIGLQVAEMECGSQKERGKKKSEQEGRKRGRKKIIFLDRVLVPFSFLPRLPRQCSHQDTSEPARNRAEQDEHVLRLLCRIRLYLPCTMCMSMEGDLHPPLL